MNPENKRPMICTLEEARSSDVAALRIAEVARITETDVRTVSGAVKRGEVPSVRIGKLILIPRLPFLAMFGE